MAVRHRPCSLTQEKRVQAFETKCLWKLLRIILLGEDHRLGGEQDQLPCGPTGASSAGCQETVVVAVVVAFFLACEDFWRMFHHSFLACAFFFF